MPDMPANHESEGDRATVARLMIVTVVLTALLMAFGITLIAHGGPVLV
jgi:hypothetical protein